MTSLLERFVASVSRWPDRPAVALGDRSWSYRAAAASASAVAGALHRASPNPPVPLTAVLGTRSYAAYVGVLGALARGHGFVPLNPSFPAEVTRRMIDTSGLESVVVAPEGVAKLGDLLDLAGRPLRVVLYEADGCEELRRRFPQHAFSAALPDAGVSLSNVPSPQPEAVAYLMFTSGSTGIPKGVAIPNRAINHFIDVMLDRYGVVEADRFSQVFPLNFDLSVFDLFMPWSRGACVCAPTREEALALGRFIQSRALTFWFSTPSGAGLIRRLGALEPGAFPNLRVSLFGGEGLPVDLASAWAAAAPASIVENLYGPTELTLSCTLHRYDAATAGMNENGLVPIGFPYPGMSVMVVDEDLHEVSIGEVGELLMAGPQLALGYWNDPVRTGAAFVVPPGKADVYYRTGDRVRRPAPGEPLKYLGRADAQIKVLGARVELGEVEAVVREESGADAVAIGWPVTTSGVEGTAVFVLGDQLDWPALRARLLRRLPAYAVPRRAMPVEAFPTTTSGKIDRSALRTLLEKVARVSVATPRGDQ